MTVIFRLFAVGLLTALAACNTVEGFGRDVKGGGEAITGTAKDVQDQL
jgi:entericidin B